MAFVSQELKRKLAPNIRKICKKYGVKASLAVRNHMTLVLNVKSGGIDFIDSFTRVHDGMPWDPANRAHANKNGKPLLENSIDVNVYWYKNHFDGQALAFLSEVIPAMNDGNWDKSDIQTDYFNVGWYVDVHIGRWNKPYKYQ